MNRHRLAQKATPVLALSAILLASLTACGGGSSPEQPAAPAATSAAADTDTAAQSVDSSTLDSATVAALARTEAQPAYHMAPALLDEPGTADVGGTNASARQRPQRLEVDAAIADIDTARLTRAALVQRMTESSRRVATASGSAAAPLTTAIIGAVHTPAQIRAAYGLPELPAAGATLTASAAAALGAGQTIYLVDAYHDATALSDLNAFSTRFGLPTCTNVAIATNAVLPLAKPPSTCTFSAVNSTTLGAMTATVPAYNGTWVPESKLDVQWAHAIAPLARIVLIEMPGAMSNNILDANTLAGKLGAGVVSMSFGSAEASWASAVDSKFAAAGMTYVAAAGDSGTQVLWPAVSPNVVAVGGTSLNWTGTGTRYEAAWAHSGGGMSAYVKLPSWQTAVTPAGGATLTRRAVPDVAFNANPATGEYVALTLPGAATVWSSYGGTSIAAPQWAAIVAVANAIRVANGKALLGDVHTLLYKSIAAVPGTYASSFGDVIDGTNGTCTTCRAGTGFDQATGWGTPNSAQLLQTLTGVSSTNVVAAAPVVPGGSVLGKVGTALSQSLGATAPAGTTTSYALSGAPAGLTVDSTGTLKWAAPVAGSYTFTATASTATGKSASGTYSLKVVAGTAPAFWSSAQITAKAGVAFSGLFGSSNPNAGTLTFTAAGAPAGFTIGANTGTITWAAPVAGTYSFTAKVTDNYGFSGTQAITATVTSAAVAVAVNHAPTLAAVTLSEKAGLTFAVRLTGQDADGDALTYSMTGAPAGAMMLSAGTLTWSGAIKGTYAITVTVRDSHGATGSAVVTLVVA